MQKKQKSYFLLTNPVCGVVDVYRCAIGSQGGFGSVTGPGETISLDFSEFVLRVIFFVQKYSLLYSNPANSGNFRGQNPPVELSPIPAFWHSATRGRRAAARRGVSLFQLIIVIVYFVNLRRLRRLQLRTQTCNEISFQFLAFFDFLHFSTGAKFVDVFGKFA